MNNTVWQQRMLATEPRVNDIRTDWDRDFARLIHSSAFRRLQSKTQVLGLGESDFYRTRLTHSMEVAQIGTGILNFLKDKYKNDTELYSILPNTQLMSAICLGHDIGHPPFGHGGEVALNYCMRDFGGFEGNGQTLRILSKLDKYTEKNGLNPSRRMLLGVLKYPVEYSKVVNTEVYNKNIDINLQKPEWLFKAKPQKPPKCFHDEEIDVVKFILEPFEVDERFEFQAYNAKDNEHSETLYHSLDTSIMELADDISYSLHDFEDAISLGMITRESWINHFKEKEDFFKECHTDYFKETSQSIADHLFGPSHKRKVCIGSLVNLMVTNTEILSVASDKFISPLLKYNAKLSGNIEALRKEIFKLVKTDVILNENVQLLEFKGQKLVIELFNVLATDPERFLPKATKERWGVEEEEKQKMRVICDYISGMTDDYATRLYEKIFQTRKGSIFDRL